MAPRKPPNPTTSTLRIGGDYRTLSRGLTPGGLALLLAVAAACRPGPARGPLSAPAPDRFLDHPDRLTIVGSEAAAPADRRPGSLEWDRAGLRRTWRGERGPLGFTLLSPPLPFASLAEIDRIEVTLSTDRPPALATLLWNDRETLSRAQQLRNRRELTLPAPRGTLVVRGEEIFDGSWHEQAEAAPSFRHLFIRLPAKGGPTRVEFVRVVPRDEVFASRAAGRARHAIAGETRDVLFLRTPGALTYRTRVAAGAMLTFGVAAAGPPASIRFTVRVAPDGSASSRLLLDERLAGMGWRDVRLPLPTLAGEEARITLAAASEPPGATVLWSAPRLALPHGAEGPPNVILYVLDGLRADRLGLYGYARGTSPFLDELGARGVVFRRFFAAATWTKPSVATLLTSLHPGTHGVGSRTYTDALPEAVPTLADLLRDSGYVTAQFVANPLAGSLSNLDQGFDYATGPEGLGSAPAGPARPKVRSDEINAKVLPWLAAHAHDRFFVYVHSMDTHTPYAGGSDAYDDEVRANDLGLRRLYAVLAALGLADTTLLVVTADHGESFGEHGVTGHGSSVYQEEASVPLVLAHGSLTPGRVDLPAHHVDVLPTILGRCGVRLDGRSLEGVDLLAEPRPGPAPRTLFVTRFAYPLDDLFEPTADREWHAVVRGDWKLIVRHPRDPREPPSQALYDLAKDPRETADLSAHRSREVEELSGALRDFHARERVRRAEFLARYPGPVTMGLAGSTPPIPASLVESLKSLGYIR